MQPDVKVKGRRGALCRCDCGTERVVTIQNLVSGISKSCGCYKLDHVAHTHGQSRTPGYRVWGEIIQRCCNPRAWDYKDYGGRGITIWDGWRRDYAAFAAYRDSVLGPKPEGATLDRIDNDGNYEPGNLRWATRQTQAMNRRPRYHCPGCTCPDRE